MRNANIITQYKCADIIVAKSKDNGIDLSENILTDAFGIVAMVAMTPLLTIQLMGLYSKLKKKLAKHQQISLEHLDDCIVFFDEN